MNTQRRGRLTAATIRLAVQPYPAVAQRCLEWMEGVDGIPQLRVSHPVPAPPIGPQWQSTPASTSAPAALDWPDQATLWQLQQQQAHMNAALQLHFPTAPTVRMRDRDEVTVTSTMHTESMPDWDDAASEATVRHVGNVERGRGVSLPPEGEEDEADCENEGSEYVPSTRSASPSPQPEARKNIRKKADLDEEYDKEERDQPEVDLGAVINEETSEPRAKRARLCGSRDVEGVHSR